MSPAVISIQGLSFSSSSASDIHCLGVSLPPVFAPFLVAINSIRISYKISHKVGHSYLRNKVYKSQKLLPELRAERPREVQRKQTAQQRKVWYQQINPTSTHSFTIYCQFEKQTHHDILNSSGSQSGVVHLRVRRSPKSPPQHLVLHHGQAPCLPTTAPRVRPPMKVPPFHGYSNIFSDARAPTKSPYGQCIHSIQHRKLSNPSVNRFGLARLPYPQVRQARIALRRLQTSHQSTSKTNSPPKALQTILKAA